MSNHLVLSGGLAFYILYLPKGLVKSANLCHNDCILKRRAHYELD